ncbi:outer membrane protein assembly factor BamB family protein [Neorhodopirellula pilleata]|nr:PQQ-binding-like beta-propeller repeat protein [Neorhodopirellula pilleata]
MPTPSQNSARGPLRRAIASGLIGGGLLVAVQVYAPSTDYQYAFFATVAIGLVTIATVSLFLQIAFHRTGYPWLVPAVATLVAITFFGTVRVKTLSGEMIPQFEWRFASRKVPELQIAPQAVPIESVQAETNPNADDTTTELIEPPSSQWITTWGQFLGNQRDGVVGERLFEIPESSAEVTKRWNIGIGGGWASFAIATDADGNGIAVTLEQREARECVTAYDLSNGELKWIVDHEAYHFHPLGEGGPRSTPTIHDNRVYAQGATGMVWCLSLETGEQIWKRDLLQAGGWDQAASEIAITWGRSGSPLLVDGQCIVPLGGPTVVNGEQADRALISLNAQTGETRWTAGDQQISYASPQLMTLDGVRQIVSVNESNITGHAIDTGKVLWQTDWPGQSSGGANCAAAIAAGTNRFVVGKGYGGGSALIEVTLNGEDWQVNDIWRSNRVMKTKFNHCVVRDGIAYGLSNGALQAVELESGERLWEQGRGGRYGQGQVILAEDVLIVQAEMGDVALVAAEPNEFNELIRIPALDQKTWNVPSLSGNILLVRNGEEAVAFDLPGKK